MTVDDRFTIGLVAGSIAGVVQLLWSLMSRFVFHWTNKSLAGFGALISFNKPPESLFEHFWGSLVALGTAAGLGIVFAYLLFYIRRENLYLKAVVFSMAAWYLLNDAIIPRISDTTEGPFSLGTVSSGAIGSILFGVVLAFIFKYFMERAHVER